MRLYNNLIIIENIKIHSLYFFSKTTECPFKVILKSKLPKTFSGSVFSVGTIWKQTSLCFVSL